MMTARLEEMSRHWPVAFAAFFGIVLGAWAVPIYTLGPLSTPLIAEFGWPPSTLFASVSALSLGLAIGSPVVGELADRHSARVVALGSMLALAACVALLGCMTGAPWQLHLLFFLMGLLGSGTGGIIYTRAIGDRFQAARGLALGLALSGTGVASFAAPLFVDQVVHIAGWRAVGPTFAGLMILVAMPILAWGLRPSSERNGASQAENRGEAAAAISRKEALRDFRFYLLLAPLALFGLFVSSLIINISPALINRGISASKAAQIASILGIATILGRVTIGWMIDRWPATLIGAASFAIGAVGLVWFAQGESAMAVFAVFAFGFLIGAEIDLMSFLVLRFFGVASFGSIFGLMFSLFSVASICGPLLCAGLVSVFGLTGFYWAAAAAFAIAAGILLLLHQRRDEGAMPRT